MKPGHEELLQTCRIEEGFFEIGVVTEINERYLGYIVLSAVELAPNDVYDFYYPVKDNGLTDFRDDRNWPWTIDDCQEMLEDLDKAESTGKLPHEPRRASKDEIPDEDWQKFEVGSIIHGHHILAHVKDEPRYKVRQYIPIYCPKPEVLDTTAMKQTITARFESQREAIKQQIGEFEQAEQRLLAELKVVRIGDEFSLFDGAEITYDDKNEPHLSIPDRILVGERLDVHLIHVRARPYFAKDAEDSGFPFWTYSEENGGREYRMNDIFPFEELNEQGVPSDFSEVPRFRLEIYIHRPNRKLSGATEEQQVVVTLGDKSYRGVPDYDGMIGSQGYGGVPFDSFKSTETNEPDYRIVTEGAPRFLDLPYGNQIIVPADLIVLGEIKVIFPGLDQ